MKHLTLRLALLLIFFFSVERFCHKKTHGFRLTKIQSDLPYLAQYNCEPPPKNLIRILSQPFRFLNSGGECYAFVSDDGRYVLKLFKHHHMRKEKLEDHFLPKSFRKKLQRMRHNKLHTLFTSCKLAHDHFEEGTGLLYLHLNQTKHLKRKIQIYDAIGCLHKIDLDTHTFALQKRAQMAYPSLDMLIELGELKAAKARIDSLIRLIASRCDAGLADHDARKRNFGFVGSCAIELDLGSFTLDQALQNTINKERVLLYETSKLKRWVAKRDPKLAPYVDEILKELLSEKK